MLPLINEAVAVLRERIVEDADLIDAGVIFGAGFAPFRGGPIQCARTLGVDAPKLREMGISGIFLPGSPMQDIIDFINARVQPRAEAV